MTDDKRFPLEWFTGRKQLGQYLNVIPHGSSQPHPDGRYIDRQGRIFEWDDEEYCWSHTFHTKRGFVSDLWDWGDVDPRDLPWTELHA